MEPGYVSKTKDGPVKLHQGSGNHPAEPVKDQHTESVIPRLPFPMLKSRGEFDSIIPKPHNAECCCLGPLQTAKSVPRSCCLERIQQVKAKNTHDTSTLSLPVFPRPRLPYLR